MLETTAKLDLAPEVTDERTMADQNRGERLQIMLTQDELAALDDWRFSRRMPSRAAAVRELLRRGLTADGADLSHERRKSKDFSVTDGPASHGPADGKGRMNGRRGNGSGDGAAS